MFAQVRIVGYKLNAAPIRASNNNTPKHEILRP